MAKISIPDVKALFQTGDRPTQENYEDLIDTAASQATDLGSKGNNENTVNGIENVTVIDNFDATVWRMVKYIISISKTSAGDNKFYATELTILVDAVNKDFKIKQGLVVEGLQGTINGEVILTENAGDQYILDLIGGETLVKSVEATQLEVSVAGKLSVKANVFDAYGAAADAEAAAALDATSKANAAEADAISAAATDATNKANAVASDLTDHENATVAHGATGAVVGTTNTQTLTNKTIGDTLNFTGAGAMTINSDSHIVLTPAAGSSVKWGADVLATQAYADTAEQDAKNYADSLAGNYDVAGAAAAAQAAAEGFATQAVADLVNGAPALLDTLDELALALQDNPDVIANIQSVAAGKQDTLTAGSNIDITGATISVTGLDSADISDFNTAALSATSAAYDTAGAAAQALSDAEDYANALTTADIAEDAVNGGLYFTNQRAIDAVGGTIGDQIDLLDTDDIEEGTTNQYFLDSRAKASAADLILGASLTNIAITGNSTTGLIITAENGVADSTTSDLAEGTNKYFTDARAVDALEAVVPNFTAVELNSVAKQVAATLSAPTAGIQVAHAFAKADYRSAEYLVKVAYGTHTEISKVLLTLDSSDNIAITEYGIVGTNGSASSVSAGISGSNVQLQVTTVNNNSTVTVMGTLLK